MIQTQPDDSRPLPAAPADDGSGASPVAATSGAGFPPWQVWAASVAAALLHALPFLRTRLTAPAPGQAWIGVPYIPKDWLQYLALLREAPLPAELFLANPFTTEPQGGRFVLLLHQLLGFVHRVTGIDPGWLLELARAALIVAFAIALWRFLDGFFESRSTRAWAVVLALLSGGVAFVATWAAQWLPPTLAATVGQELWSMYGWTTYQALFNPLWVAGLVLLLVGLRPLLRPGGPRSTRDLLQASAALLLLWFTHVYTAIALVAIVAASLAGEWLAGGAVGWRRAARVGLAVVPPLLVAALVVRWQQGDEVFARAAGGVLGPQSSSVFWYPIAFAVTGAFAIAGWSRWIASRHPWRYAIGGWLVGIAILQSSPLVNGYHFVLYAYVPIAIFAADPVSRVFERLRRGGGWALAAAAALALALFANTPASALGAVREVEAFQIPADAEAVLVSLAGSPPGNVLCAADLGNLVPAYGSHRVYVGHWFLTPDYAARAARVARALAPGGFEDLQQLVSSERIDEVIIPSPFARDAAAALASLAPRIERHGDLSIVHLRGR